MFLLSFADYHTPTVVNGGGGGAHSTTLDLPVPSRHIRKLVIRETLKSFQQETKVSASKGRVDLPFYRLTHLSQWVLPLCPFAISSLLRLVVIS